MALPPRDQRHSYLGFEGLEYTDANIVDFEEMLGKIYGKGVHLVLFFNFWGLTAEMAEGLSGRMLMERRDAQGQRISSEEDFLGTSSSYNVIRDPMLRLCHRLIACSIAGRSQAPEKVTVTDLFYLRGIDAPRPPPIVASVVRTMPWRMARLEEEVHRIRESLAKQREVMDVMARDFSRFTMWAASGISQLLDVSGDTYTRYFETHVPYQRRKFRQRTKEANTLVAPRDKDQPDP
nr:hypothetical protein [Tanacetum cinerariifolium]